MSRRIRNAIVRECGNGLPGVGEYAVESVNGEVYRILSIVGPIQTGRYPGDGSWVRACVMMGDWEDINAGNEPYASCTIEDERADYDV